MGVGNLSRSVEAAADKGDGYLLKSDADLAEAVTYAIGKSVASARGKLETALVALCPREAAGGASHKASLIL